MHQALPVLGIYQGTGRHGTLHSRGLWSNGKRPTVSKINTYDRVYSIVVSAREKNGAEKKKKDSILVLTLSFL